MNDFIYLGWAKENCLSPCKGNHCMSFFCGSLLMGLGKLDPWPLSFWVTGSSCFSLFRINPLWDICFLVALWHSLSGLAEVLLKGTQIHGFTLKYLPAILG